ncbi:MAG: hypothetical protein GXO91_04745 [FCB group bacterium]|nr:hypothetical protein [FCB group bacterium]
MDKEEQPIPSADRSALTRFAARIVGHGFSVPMIFFLEAVKYMNFIGSQLMVFFGPIVTSLVNSDNYYKLAELIEDRKNVEFIITEIERLEAESKKQK